MKPASRRRPLLRRGCKVLAQPCPEQVAMDISGHTPRAVFNRYNIISEDDLRMAAQKTTMYFDTPSDGAPAFELRNAAPGTLMPLPFRSRATPLRARPIADRAPRDHSAESNPRWS
jgi:hypothetical protein